MVEHGIVGLALREMEIGFVEREAHESARGQTCGRRCERPSDLKRECVREGASAFSKRQTVDKGFTMPSEITREETSTEKLVKMSGISQAACSIQSEFPTRGR